MTTYLVTGYKSFELGIFQDKDPKVAFIKKAIEKDLIRLLDEGLEWLVFTGNLGFEVWVLEVAKSLKEDYDLSLATIFPFENHGHQWNEANQVKLAQFKALDFVKYTYPSYDSPRQLAAYQQFLLDNTDGAYVFYDREHETKLSYLVDKMKEQEDYETYFLDFDRLNELMAEDWD